MLAGGRSTRMHGREKSLISLAGRSLLDRASARLSPQVDCLVINANTEDSAFRAYGVPVVADAIADRAGPLAGILAGLRWVQSHCPNATVLTSTAVDTPYFPKNLVSILSNCASRPEAVVLAASANGIHPVFGLWPIAIADDLQAFLRSGANPKVRDFAARHDCRMAMFGDILLPNGERLDPFFNINTPGDAARAEVIAKHFDALETA
ncbi:MAG TPA: molybdenum cofactor guanylyltransferase MobA [Rhizomicrobium sp.]